MVEAVIHGTETGLSQDIVLTGHLQEGKTSANENGSESAHSLEVRCALVGLVDSGVLPRLWRNLRLWWTTQNLSERQFFRGHPDEGELIWVNVSQDIVGADQSQDLLRQQSDTGLLATRFHFLNDGAEAAIEYMVDDNTMELVTFQNGIPGHPKPHVAELGSRHRYAAEMVFLHANTDHVSFMETATAIPGISFTDFPDRFMHSSDGVLWELDRTQPGRNAVAASVIAYIMASASGAEISALAAGTVGQGREGMGRNLRLGQTWLARPGDRAAAWWDAVDQLWSASSREGREISSLLSAYSAAADMARAELAGFDRGEQQALRELELSYMRLTGFPLLPKRLLSAVERKLSRLTPVVTALRGELMERCVETYAVEPPRLHPLMAFEALNAMDEERRGLEILRLVAARAWEEGAHYYGEVAAEDHWSIC
jgi:hypothetical protein